MWNVGFFVKWFFSWWLVAGGWWLMVKRKAEGVSGLIPLSLGKGGLLAMPSEGVRVVYAPHMQAVKSPLFAYP